MVPKCERRELSVQESSGGEDLLEERRAASKTAEGSGRLPKVEIMKRATSFARQQDSEDWQQPPLDCPEKKLVNYMVELDAGSGVFFQGCAQKWSFTEVQFNVALEDPPNSVNLWLRLTSSRIWRGPMSQKAWRHLGKGAWKPKTRTAKGRARAKAKKRSIAEDTDDGDEAAVTTTTVPSDDEEVAATAMEDGTPSPHAVKGSNAVSPEADAKQGFKGGPGAARIWAKAALGQNQFSSQGVTDVLAASPRPSQGTLQASGGIVVKTEPEETKGSGDRKRPNLYIQWLTRHLQLLGHQGQLNTCPGGNPESGSLPGTSWQTSNQDSQKDGATSSSSGSAGQAHDVSHNSSVPKTSNPRDPRAQMGQAKRNGRNEQIWEPQQSQRSASPATPNQQRDGDRAGQRSSSVDGDHRSVIGSAAGGEGGRAKAGGKSHARKADAAPQARPAEASAEASGIGKSVQKHFPAVHSPQKKPLKQKQALQSGQSGFQPHKVPPGKVHPWVGSKNGSSHQVHHGSKTAQANPTKKQQGLMASSQGHFASPKSPEAVKALPALVETDPFAEPGSKKQRAI